MTLTFEKFTKPSPRVPAYNNFPLHWAAEDTTHRLFATQRDYYQRFQREQGTLDARLFASIPEALELRNTLPDTAEDPVKPFENDLYEAYVIMSGYGVEDDKLFQ